MQTYKKLLFLLSPHERSRAVLLLILIFITSLLEMLGVASILPFIAVLTNPTLIETNNILKILFQISNKLGTQTHQEFLIFLGALAFLTLVISVILKLFTIFIQTRFIFMREYSIGKRLVEGYLHQPYSWFLSHNSADLGKTILSEVSKVITNGIKPLIELIGRSILVTLLITLLIIVDPSLIFVVGLSLSCAYLLIFYSVRSYLTKIGNKRLKSNQSRFTAVSEAFGAAKEVKVGSLEKFFIKNFTKSAQTYSKTQAISIVIGQFPRFILEAIAFGGILLLIIYKMAHDSNLNNSLPIISVYVFAGYRLLPALQQIYNSFTQLTFASPSIDRLYNDLNNLTVYDNDQEKNILAFNKEIILNDINFNYPNTSRTALKNINLSIPINSTVGLIGPTGCGKTTTVDIILGLLIPQNGTLEVDGKVITEQNSKAWQRLIGYVPQQIYLSDDTILANVAFGVEHKNIDQDMVKKVSKIANLHEFVTKELPQQYETIVGERGIRLSGGQRQRIGIARALYHNPKVLILDEATSALDNQTEEAVMRSINNISKDITIILIAHRLNTVDNCDIIFEFDKGIIKKISKKNRSRYNN